MLTISREDYQHLSYGDQLIAMALAHLGRILIEGFEDQMPQKRGLSR